MQCITADKEERQTKEEWSFQDGTIMISKIPFMSLPSNFYISVIIDLQLLILIKKRNKGTLVVRRSCEKSHWIASLIDE